MDNQNVLPDLIEQLQVESLGNDVFNGISTDIFGTGRIFGGQVLGQSLMAASLTVSPGRAVHSLHSYFLRPGDTSKPIRFEVERTRDGGSFSARRVIASQLDQPIFIMSSSFQGEEPGFQHQTPAPVVTPPDSLKNEKQLIADFEHKLPKRLASLVGRDFAIEMRPVEPTQMLKPGNYDPQAHIWFRAADNRPTTRCCTAPCLPIHQISTCCSRRCCRITKRPFPKACKWPPLTMPSGFTARSVWTNGCSTRWSRPAPAMHAGFAGRTYTTARGT